jgi:hypothetical protein
MLVPLLIGFFLMHIFLPFKRMVSEHLLLKGSLAVGLGFGITSCTYFLCLLLLGPAISGIILSEAGILVFLTFFFIHAVKTRILSGHDTAHEKILSDLKLRRILSGGFFAVLALTVTNIFYRAKLLPDGMWDSWAIWNLRARFIFRGGEYWTDAFSSLLAPNHHPDYPLLIPLTVSRCWMYIGSEIKAVPMLIALLFTCATAGMLYSALAVLRSKSQGLIATMLLFSTPIFINVGVWQQADIPTAFFFMASIVFLFLQDRFPDNYGCSVFAGVMTGLSGWTKNEGLLFMASFFLARIVLIIISKDRKILMKQLMYFALGTLPVVTIIMYYKFNFVPPNDLVSGERGIGEIVSKLKDYSRYMQIMKEFLADIMIFFPHALLLLFYPLYFGFSINDKIKTGILTSLFVLLFLMTGYFVIYLITPYDLSWHLTWSSDRLLLHLWPSFLLIYFIIVRTPDEVLMSRQIEMVQKV